jgi:hypothetical protein
MGNSALTKRMATLGKKDAKKDAKSREANDAAAFAAAAEAQVKATLKKLADDIANARLRKEILVAKALTNGADIRDPWHTICVCAAWGIRPTIKGNKLMVKFPGVNGALSTFTQVGEIYFSPLGGIRGLRVVDRVGDVMISEGDCASKPGRWSHAVRGFHLLEGNQS